MFLEILVGCLSFWLKCKLTGVGNSLLKERIRHARLSVRLVKLLGPEFYI